MTSHATFSITRSTTPPPVEPRWASLGFGLLVLLLLAFEVVRTMPEAWLVTPTVTLLLVTQVTAPVLGLFIAPQTVWQRICALVLALLNLALAMSVIAFSGGFTSLLWPIITVPLIALLLLMPGPAGIGTALAIWCAYGSFAFMMPHSAQLEALTAWLLHGGVVGLFVLLLEQSIHVQHTMRRRAKIREHVLRDFLYASNRLRATTRVQTIIEEVAMTAQSVGDFDCVTLSQVHWGEGCAHVSVAIGSSGQRLLDIEGRAVPWSEFAAILEAGQFAGGQARVCDSLPFRSIRDETHLVLPLFSQFDEVQGVLTVSASRRNRRALREALPLLELLANQSVALIDNATLYSTMGQRVEAATAELEQGTEELRRARDRAEVLYRISRALAATLDERQVLDRTLALVAQFTRADRGGIMLVEPHTGWLVFRTTLDCRRAGAVRGLERGRGLAGWVLAKREAVIVPDTSRDSRWEKLNAYDTHVHSVLAAPLLLESEALGVLILIHSDINHFNADHLQLVQAAANQSAVALSKAQLYRYVSEQSERLGVTAQQREMEASKTMAILRSIGDGVIVGDRLGRVRLINPAAEHILGITAEAFLGRPLADLPGAPQDKDGDADRLQQFVIGERTVRAHFAPVMSAKDEWLGSVVVYHDITREEMADRLKSELVATASHELRTPLTSMRGYVDMLMLDTFGPLNPSQRDFLRIVKNNVTRLVHLVDELLDMSRVEAGEVRLRREEVDLVEMFYETSQSLHGQFNERNVTLHMDLQDNLPVVLADRQRLQQILINLVGNACKYTEPGGQVDIALYNGGDKLRVDVRDTGVGIPEDAKPHIFTPFYRAENPLRDEVGGTGLGLSITRKLVEMHGGEIWFESAEGKGSTFSFTLPLSSYQSTAQ